MRLLVTYNGTFSGPFGAGIQNAPIPSALIERHCGKKWVNYEFRQSVAAIDSLLAGCSDGSLMLNSSDLMLLLQGKVYPKMSCNSVVGILSEAALVELQYNVRSKILELTIELEKRIPAAVDVTIGALEPLSENDTKAVTQLTQQIFHGSVTNINSSGGANSRVNLNSTDNSANMAD
ncbi:hypothetical protein [Amaricoccus sp. B4]|uniref:AbiTii domain-containing protein n=1 Tax=Amaricoccus sp. B4 TaxID=3368557 RepID=UPI00371BAB66